MSLLKEICGYISRNGFSTLLIQVVEVYLGFLLRYLPGIEGFVLRSWLYRLIFKKSGQGLYIFPNCTLTFCNRISVGKRVAINVGCYFDGRGEIDIGSDVMFGPNCMIVSCEHGYASTDIPMWKQPISYRKIVIGNDVWVGGGVSIKSGVTIGHGSVIAAGSVVVNDVEPYSVVGGVPAKVLKNRLNQDS